MILINCCNHLGEAKLGLSYHELSNLSQKYRLQMIHGNIEVSKVCTFEDVNFSEIENISVIRNDIL